MGSGGGGGPHPLAGGQGGGEWQSNSEEQACQMLERSLELDPGFEQTQQLYADFCPQALPDQPQNLDFED